MPLFNPTGPANLPQVNVDPVSPTAGNSWVKVTGVVGVPGLAMGPLGCTYAQEEIESAVLSWSADNNSVKRVSLI